jgi:histidyl-tRNA synthetase
MEKPRAPRGAEDVYPPDAELLSEVEGLARGLFDRYGYRRIDTPIFEHTEVFTRGLGDASEIVLDKEMYTFPDRRDRSLSLRPEGTASVARAFIEHDLGKKLPNPVRLQYIGPMFRYERPQKGRKRQFVHAGAECIGSAEPTIDAELIVLAAQFFEGVGLAPGLLLNSMGCAADRERYGPVLRQALADRLDDLCDDCHKRLETNPLRVFDCKVEACRKIVRGGDIPPITEYLCEECKAHYRAVQEMLEVLGIAWKDTPHLVRGLDYYTRTVFEFEIPELGARPVVCGGGRYDGLLEQLGGAPTPACGFAIGITPTIEALGAKTPTEVWHPDVYVAWMEGLAGIALATATDLRRAGLHVTMSDEGKSLRPQLRAADRLGATRVVILGPDEISENVATVREMGDGTERKVGLADLVNELSP